MINNINLFNGNINISCVHNCKPEIYTNKYIILDELLIHGITINFKKLIDATICSRCKKFLDITLIDKNYVIRYSISYDKNN